MRISDWSSDVCSSDLIENLELPQLNAITSSLIIRGNKQLKAIKNLQNLYFVNGSLTITGNPLLTDLSGLLGLKLFKGTLAITDNTSLGENQPCSSNEVGFCVIKYLMQSGRSEEHTSELQSLM